jgi:hypothetical protein
VRVTEHIFASGEAICDECGRDFAFGDRVEMRSIIFTRDGLFVARCAWVHVACNVDRKPG